MSRKRGFAARVHKWKKKQKHDSPKNHFSLNTVLAQISDTKTQTRFCATIAPSQFAIQNGFAFWIHGYKLYGLELTFGFRVQFVSNRFSFKIKNN